MSHSSNGSIGPTVDITARHHDVHTNGVEEIFMETRNISDARLEEIAVICHELRNSLAVVRNAAGLLRPPHASDRIDTARSLIERHAGQMSRHIENLLEPLRHVGSNHALQIARVDVRVIARHAIDAIGPEVSRHGHRLAVRLPEEPIWMNADGMRLEEVFLNLLTNATKYTPDSGDIALTVERDQGQVSVRVRDSGMGMEPAMLSRVFDMFVQADTALPRAKGGFGIGLCVARNLVEQHGGTITASSQGLGFGSEFTVVLPVLQAQP